MNSNSTHNRGSLAFTKKVDYGLILLTSCATQAGKQPLSLKKVAEEFNISFFFLQKIAKELKSAGIIQSTRGKSGGYTLERIPENISIQEVVEVLDGKIAIMDCANKECNCERAHNCPISPGIRSINDEVRDLMLSKKLSHFI